VTLAASARAAARPSAGWRWAAAGAAAGLLGCAVVASGVSRALEASRPDLAVQVLATPGALGRLAQRELAAGRPQQARALAARALAQAPLDVRALRVYALSLPAGEARRRDAVMAFAGERSWRDSDTQLWLLQARLAAGDAAGAMRHADALLRRLVKSREPIFQLLVPLAAHPRGAEAIAERLAARPNWRPAYLAYLSRQAADPALASAMLKRLAALGAGPTDEELQPLLSRIVRDGQAPQAARVLQDFRPAPPPDLLRDGGFEGAPAVAPFAWSLRTAAGLDINIADRAGGGRALQVDYDGYGRATSARQLLVLPPGAWRLSGEMLSGSPDVERLSWRVSCAGAGRTSLGEVAARPTGEAWQAFSVDFTVPAGADCAAQWISLVGAPGARRTSISALFDSLAIARIGNVEQAEP